MFDLQTMIAQGVRYTGWNWFNYPEQSSEKIYLEKGKPYYLEARYREYGGADWVEVGVMMFDAPFVSSELQNVFNEQQRISIMSDVVLEQQVCLHVIFNIKYCSSSKFAAVHFVPT